MPHDVVVATYERERRAEEMRRRHQKMNGEKKPFVDDPKKTYLKDLREGDYFTILVKGKRSISNIFRLVKIRKKKMPCYLVAVIFFSGGKLEQRPPRESMNDYSGEERVQLILKESMNDRYL